MAVVSLTDLRSVFVFFVVFMFRSSSLNKEISLSSSSLLVSRNSFSFKPQNLVSIHCFLRKKWRASAILSRSPCKPNA